MSGRETLYNFKRGQGLHTEQQDTLGRIVPDPEGNGAWCYGQFVENGQYRSCVAVEHGSPSEIAEGNITKGSPEGGRLLHATGIFADKDIVGAIGFIEQGSSAGGIQQRGQNFYVTKMVSKDTIEVHVLTDTYRTRTNGVGWADRLFANGETNPSGGTVTFNTSFKIWFPGRFYHSTGPGALNAGMWQGQRFTVTDDYKPFGYVKCRGLAFGLMAGPPAPGPGDALTVVQTSGNPTDPTGRISIGGNLEEAVQDVTGDSRAAVARNATLQIKRLGQTVGRAIVSEGFTGSVGTLLTPFVAEFPDWGESYRHPYTENPENTIRR